jgi:hypothetical protein
MRLGSIVSVLLVSCAAASTAAAQSDVMPAEKFHVEIGTEWWQPTPHLSIQTDALASVGLVDFDFADEFAIDPSWFSEFRAVLKPARTHKFRVSYVPVRYEQTSPLRTPISFNGSTFAGSATATLKWNLWRFGYEWDFMSRERGFVGMLADIKYNKVSASVRGRGVAEATKAQAPIPGLGVIGRGYVHPKVSISGEFTGFKIVGGDVEGSFFDFDISATANIFKSLGVQGGYRAVNADYTVDSDVGDLTLRGPYIGIVSRF